MLEDYFIDIDIYTEAATEDDWGNLDSQGNWTYYETIQGLLQLSSSDYSYANNRMTPISSHVLYTDMDVTLQNGWRIELDGYFYEVINPQAPQGISSVLDHQEFDVNYLGDLDEV